MKRRQQRHLSVLMRSCCNYKPPEWFLGIPDHSLRTKTVVHSDAQAFTEGFSNPVPHAACRSPDVCVLSPEGFWGPPWKYHSLFGKPCTELHRPETKSWPFDHGQQDSSSGGCCTGSVLPSCPAVCSRSVPLYHCTSHGVSLGTVGCSTVKTMLECLSEVPRRDSGICS